jgi:uncharacterized membrane protein
VTVRAGTARSRTVPPAAAWPAIAAVSAASVGLGISAYLTAVHYTSTTLLACSASGLIDCERVVTSARSTMFGVPVAVAGMAWFLVMGTLSVPPAWRSRSPLVVRSRAMVAATGMAFVLYLVYVELFVVGAVCLWCTAAHVAVFILFVVVMLKSP